MTKTCSGFLQSDGKTRKSLQRVGGCNLLKMLVCFKECQRSHTPLTLIRQCGGKRFFVAGSMSNPRCGENCVGLKWKEAVIGVWWCKSNGLRSAINVSKCSHNVTGALLGCRFHNPHRHRGVVHDALCAAPLHRIASNFADGYVAVLSPDSKHQATECLVALFFSRASTAFQSMFEKKASMYLGRSAGL